MGAGSRGRHLLGGDQAGGAVMGVGWQQVDSAGQAPESQQPVQLPPHGLPLLIDSPGEGRSGCGGIHPAPASLPGPWVSSFGEGVSLCRDLPQDL